MLASADVHTPEAKPGRGISGLNALEIFSTSKCIMLGKPTGDEAITEFTNINIRLK